MPVKSPEQLYEQARSAGLSHKTALEVARPQARRGALSGDDWPTSMDDPVKDLQYAGAAPTIDCGLWLKKVGAALTSQWVMPRLARAELPIVTNARVRLENWWLDGCLALDLEHRHVGGRREYTSCRIPIGACLAHDTEYVLRRVLVHLGQRNVKLVEHALLNETDLRHVAG